MTDRSKESREFDRFADLVDRMVTPKKPDTQESSSHRKGNGKPEHPPNSDQKDDAGY